MQSKHIIAFMAGLVFCRFLPQYALMAFIIAFIALALRVEAKRGTFKKMRRERQRAKKTSPATGRQSRSAEHHHSRERHSSFKKSVVEAQKG